MTKILRPLTNNTLTEPTKTVWSRLFRQMLLDRNIGPARFGSLMKDYLEKHKGDRGRAAVQSMGRKLLAKFTKGNMTWEGYKQALEFLQIEDVQIIIQTDNDKVHSTQFKLKSVPATPY